MSQAAPCGQGLGALGPLHPASLDEVHQRGNGDLPQPPDVGGLEVAVAHEFVDASPAHAELVGSLGYGEQDPS